MRIFPVLGTMVGVALAVQLPTAAHGERRVALVIGNGAYVNAPHLTNPANDAKAVAEALKRLGFDVHLALDVTQQQTLKQLDEFTAVLPGAEAALLYYSGHGLQLEGSSYLLPVDIEVSSERSVRYGAIDIAEIVRDMEKSADVSLVVLDACRDNPFLKQLEQSAGGTRSIAASRGLARIKPSGNGTIIAYSAGSGEVASDGDGVNSPYTKAFLDQVAAANVEVGLMFRRVAGKVVDATGGAQRPEVLISLTREYYMKLEASQAPGIAPPAPEPPAAKTSSTPAKGPATEPSGVAVATPPLPVSSQAPAMAAAKPPTAGEAVGGRTAGAGPAPAGGPVPYPQLLARLDFSEPIYQPPARWTPSERHYLAETEPNDSPATANPIGVNDVVKLAIEPLGDAVWLYFNAGAAGVLTARAEHQPPEINLAVRMLDAERRVVGDWKVTPRPGGVLNASFDVPTPGAYWLEVRDGNNDGHSTQPIDLALSFVGQEDAYDPDDLPSKARLIPLQGSERINIFPVGDVSFFRFPVERPGELAVKATDIPQDIEVVMRLLDADQNVAYDWVSPLRPGGDTDAVFAIKQPGFYLLEVRNRNNDHGSVQAFTLSSHFTPSPDVYEPNDSIAAATPLPATGELILTIFPQGDVDFLKVDVDHPGELQLLATEVPKNLAIVFRVIDADQRDVSGWIVPPRAGGDTTGTADLPRAGSYFIEVRQNNNDAGSVEPFKFRTHFTPSAERHAPDDTMGQATQISLGGEIAFDIFPSGDVDWFKLNVEHPGELAVWIDEGPPNLALTFQVLDADRHDLTGWVPPYTKGGRTEGYADLKAPGDYYIVIRDGNNARSIQPAILSTRFTPIDAGYPRGDSFGTAARLPLSGSNAAYILPIGNAEWEVVYAPQPGELGITIDKVPEQLTVVFHVLDGNQRDLTGWVAPPRKGGDTIGKAKIEKPGWYWIEMRNADNAARSPQPFRVTREFAAGAGPSP